MIVVANKVDDLDKLKKSIEKKYGKYNNVPYITLLQSWNKNIKCLDEEVPVLNYADSKNRCNQSCQYKECPLVKQYTEIDYSPILAVTTERFSSMSKGRNIDKYKIFHNGSKKREYIIIDEKPVILSNKSISLADINILKNILLEYPPNRNKSTVYSKKKLDILSKLDSIEKLLISYINDHNEYDNFFILPEKIDFMSDWKIVFGNKHYEKTVNIEQMFQTGIVWNKYRNNFYLVQDASFSTAGFKTFIFDGTASMTLEYRNDEFITIEMNDYKDFNNLTFHIINQNISKSKIKEDPEILTFICDWINSHFQTDTYVVSYKEALGYQVSKSLTGKLKNNKNVILHNNEIAHFGNTKGKNTWSKCTNMIQIGWNILDSGLYIAKYLSLNPDKRNELLKLKEKPNEVYSFLKNINGEFSNNDINIYKLFDMIVNLEQEVYRTNIREFSSDINVNIYLFLSSNENSDLLKTLIGTRFFGCKITDYKNKIFEDYHTNKYLKGEGKEYIRKFIEWLDGKLTNNELKGKNHGILIKDIEKKLNIKIKWQYHLGKKSEFYKLLTIRRVKVAKNKNKVLELFKY